MTEDSNIISVSRRTDVPAFYTDWFLNRLDAGFAEYLHPFTHQRFRLSLRPENVSAFVLWSKNFSPLLPHLPGLADQGYHFYCHLTINDLPPFLEPNVPSSEETIRQAKAIASNFTPHHLQWRFDPIILTNGIDTQATLQRFSRLAAALEGSTRRCYTSFVDPYSKVIRNLHQAGITLIEPTLEEKRELVARMAEIAANHGIQIYTCCEDVLLSSPAAVIARSAATRQSPARGGIPSFPEDVAQGPSGQAVGRVWTDFSPAQSQADLKVCATSHSRGANAPLKTQDPGLRTAALKGRCIDPEILSAIGAPFPTDLRPAPTRPGCGCFKSFDIGAYDTCLHSCLYCYANSNPTKVNQNHSRHNPSYPSLITADTRGLHTDSPR